MSDPTLFDELRTVAATGRRLGILRYGTDLCPQDEEILTAWAEIGIPADRSTVEAACEILIKLWHKHQRLVASLDELIEGQP